jgi:C1A family cysteine protease
MLYSLLALTLAAVAADPSGTYTGTKSILGITIDASVKIDSATTMDLTISGAVSIACAAETYAYDGSSSITLPGMDTAGDCVHDAVASEKGLAIKSISYDSSSDSVTVTAKYTIVSVSVVLTKGTAAGLLGRTLAVETAAERELMFAEFVAFHRKLYTSASERAARRAIFEETLDLITERNRAGDLGIHWVNKFADMSAEEFRATHLGYLPKTNTTASVELDLPLTASASASSIDWRTHSPKVLTPVKDQGQCGSCWAFSATEQIETDVAIATGHLYTLSPQQITSCDKTDLGCNGGNTETAYDYVASKGLEAESSYPYKSGNSGRTGTCEYQSSETVVSIKSYSTVSSKKSSEGKMLTQIAKSPISVCVDAEKWQTYSRGVLGKSCGTQLDHCVQAVGYNAAQGYWIVRNSWNTDWGVNGYIYVKEGIDACGIAKDATIVTGASASTVEA